VITIRQRYGRTDDLP